MDELIRYFESAVIPAYPIKINGYMEIGAHFIESQIEAGKAGNKSAQMRLGQFRDYLEAEKNKPASTPIL
ncbi:hypothetical protein [Spirosoma flavum]|uniref:Uncharacterized protein n=1 Tax=Spirosoma flavum TaxID=2048557 RepID=A0ABW6AQG8_9BACT